MFPDFVKFRKISRVHRNIKLIQDLNINTSNSRHNNYKNISLQRMLKMKQQVFYFLWGKMYKTRMRILMKTWLIKQSRI